MPGIGIIRKHIFARGFEADQSALKGTAPGPDDSENCGMGEGGRTSYGTQNRNLQRTVYKQCNECTDITLPILYVQGNR